MSVRVEGERVWLEGDCPAADAEALCAALIGQTRHTSETGRPGRVVDVSGALTLHAAVVQTLLALGPRIEGGLQDRFLRVHVASKLTLP